MSKRHRRPCPTSTKTSFGDKVAAELALDHIRRHDDRPSVETKPVRAYHCECGKWHLTSRRETYDDIAKRMGVSTPADVYRRA